MEKNMEKINTVYEVISTNIDVSNETFIHALYANIKDAKKACLKEVKYRKPKNVIEDFEGKLEEYDGKNLYWCDCHNYSAIYYRSRFGGDRMVMYIKTRTVN